MTSTASRTPGRPEGGAETGPAAKVALLEFLTVFRIGGTERQFVNLATALDRSRFELHLACFRREGELLAEAEQSGAPLTEYRMPSLLSLAAGRQLLRLARYLRRQRIQVVRTYGFHPNVFGVIAARLAGVPAIFASIRDTGDHLTPFQRGVQRRVCGLADRVVTNAEAVRQRLIGEGYDGRRIVVIPNGIALERYSGGKPGLRPELGLPSGVPLVAVLGRLDEGKGVEYFLEAAALLTTSHPDARFLVVGDLAIRGPGKHPHRLRLERYALELGLGGRLVFTGFRSDVPAILAEVTVSVLSSLSEGLSNTLLESMAARVPVVATAVGGNPELVEDGVTGLLVPPRDARALAAAIARLLDDPALARRLGEAGQRRVANRFSLDAMVGATEKLYLGLLEEAC